MIAELSCVCDVPPTVVLTRLRSARSVDLSVANPEMCGDWNVNYEDTTTDTVMTLRPDGTFYQIAGNYHGRWGTKGFLIVLEYTTLSLPNEAGPIRLQAEINRDLTVRPTVVERASDRTQQRHRRCFEGRRRIQLTRKVSSFTSVRVSLGRMAPRRRRLDALGARSARACLSSSTNEPQQCFDDITPNFCHVFNADRSSAPTTRLRSDANASRTVPASRTRSKYAMATRADVSSSSAISPALLSADVASAAVKRSLSRPRVPRVQSSSSSGTSDDLLSTPVERGRSKGRRP
jgi:hypothetical protein